MTVGADAGTRSTRSRTPRRTGRTVVMLTVVATMTAGAIHGAAAAQPPAGTMSRLGGGLVVVTGPDDAAAAHAVTLAGGRVTDRLPLIRGVSAQLPQGRALPPGFVVTVDHPLQVSSAGPEVGTVGPITTVRSAVGLPADGAEGNGVIVAVVDTGVADVPELAGRVVDHIDMTDSPGQDGLGHGTFMAGLIGASGEASAGAYRGVAPAAGILDVRVAGADGATGLVPVLRGLQAVAIRAHRDGIRVVSLALSSDSPTRVADDPLVQALDGLWRDGLTVVVPAGNDGPAPGSVSSPGIDPMLLTAGSVDPQGTADRSDDVVPTWSGRGLSTDELAKPDLAAVGAHVVGLRAPGSVIDTANPGSRIGADYFRGSGTSMSTAITAAAAADVLAIRPDLTPDAVKGLLTGTTYDAVGLADPDAAGAGGLDAAAALAAAPAVATDPADEPGDRDGWHKHWARTDRNDGVPGEPADWSRLAAAVGGDDPAAAAAAWDALDPESRAWASRAWAGATWSSRAWASRAWASRAWASRAWASRAWASRAWASRAWASRAWAAHEWDSASG